MKITFLGATRQVTGSCHLLETSGKKILIDCGMEQGPQIYEQQSMPVKAHEIDFVLLTHAHIDHSGRLPLLYKNGFSGEIYTTQATKQLCNIMLKDSAYIQEREAEWKNKKSLRLDGKITEPLYTIEDAENVMKHFHTHEYRESFLLDRDIKVRFLDAGHLLGSAFVEITAFEDGYTRKIVFSGDMGNSNVPLLNNPSIIESADYVVMESTYGDKLHASVENALSSFSSVIQQTFDMGGKVIIPAFAVGRTQELLYYLREIKQRNLVKGYGNFTVYVDSPLAIEATNIFEKVNSVYYDDEARRIIKKGQNPIGFPGLRLSITQTDSRMINEDDSPCVIISASGMCEAGRIRHHLKHNLWKRNNTILFSGYQVEGTLGRILLGGAKTVKLFGEEIAVNARVMKLEHVSAHADKNGLLNWLRGFKEPPKKVFVVHGNEDICEHFVNAVQTELGIEATAPFLAEEHDLILGIKSKNGMRIIKAKPIESGSAAVRQVRSPRFRELLAAFSRLHSAVEASEGLANRELEKFTKQVEELAKRWEK